MESPRSANRSNFIGTNAFESEAAAQLILPTITSESNFTTATELDTAPTTTTNIDKELNPTPGDLEY